eukprot:TRINITY_DN3837_c0_g1_i1.p1 TRINITY_DN3837_c0_g1~~TRINITY_DN3837_c0_g1_i1.p1  ORF type:complete len:146 (+),score=5.09 TRINITY_DN3837_c0_g1_i1:309-746(+)
MFGKPPSSSCMDRSASMSFVPQAGVFTASDSKRVPMDRLDFFRRADRSLYVSRAFAAARPAHFLDACHLCKKRLGDGCDIYMYRGDIAFCSDECRQQQISADEAKEKAATSIGAKKGQLAASNCHDSTSNSANYRHPQAGTIFAM